jgi:hypothetical protein
LAVRAILAGLDISVACVNFIAVAVISVRHAHSRGHI